MNNKKTITHYFSFINKKQHKIIVLLIALLLVTTMIISVFYLLTEGSMNQLTLSGIVYIDGIPVPKGSMVRFIFPSGECIDIDGTNETGYFTIDITDFFGEYFTVEVEHNGTIYTGYNETGNEINMTVSEEIKDHINVFIFSTDFHDDNDNSTNDSDDNDTNGKDNDDTDNNNDDDNSDDGEDTDDSSDNDQDNENDGQDNSDDTDKDKEDDDNNENNDNDNDDTPAEDTEEDLSFLFVKKTLWNESEAMWKNNNLVGLGKQIRFNVTIIYNSSNISEIHIIDKLSEGLHYDGNATINDENITLFYNESNQTVEWNISEISNENTTVFFEYDATVIKRMSIQSLVNVTLIKQDMDCIDKQADTTLQVYGEIKLSKKVRNNLTADWRQQCNVIPDEIIRFNITFSYNGSYQLSDITILDELPVEIQFQGNATINGVETSPMIPNAQTVLWEIDTVSPLENIFIEFDANLTTAGTIINQVEITGNESIGKRLINTAQATITGIYSPSLSCEKTVKKKNGTWQDSIQVLVGENITYKILIHNPEMLSLSGLTILDSLPSTIAYIENSSVYLYQDEIIQKEPVYNTVENTLFWNETTQLINENLTIMYNVSVLKEGQAVNNVTFNSLICGSNETCFDRDSAVINATKPLSVDLIGPSNVYVNEEIILSAEVVGGRPPYTIQWDLDDDTSFDIINKTVIHKTWSVVGDYPITIYVIDKNNETCSDTININVSIEPLLVDAGGPYFSHPHELISFNGYVTGGKGNYSWNWNFGDGTISTIQNPDHDYDSVGMYTISLEVTDERNISVIDQTTAKITYPDIIPPVITIKSPNNFIYFKNKIFFPFFMPLVFGSIDINISSYDNDSTVEQIMLYIDNVSVKNNYGNTIHYSWDAFGFGRHTLRIKAIDSEGNEQITEKTVWKFF